MPDSISRHKPAVRHVLSHGTRKGAVMNFETDTSSRAEIVDEASKWGVGAGILVTALAPLSLPILILTLVAVLPLAVPLLALGLVGAVVALPIILIRKVGRWVTRVRPSRRPYETARRGPGTPGPGSRPATGP